MFKNLHKIFLPFSIFFIFSTLNSLDHKASETPQEQEEISDWEARIELARVLSYLKKYEESLQEYQKLLKAKPNSSAIRLEMAKVLFYQDKTEEALVELAKIPPQDIDDQSWIMVADIYRKKKNYPEAEKIYVKYLEKYPEDDKVRLKLAELLSWQKRYGESLDQYHLILKTHPDDVQIRRRYAQVLTWANRDEEAVQEWRKSLLK